MLGHTGFRRFWGRRRRGLLAVVGAVLALTGIVVALVPSPSSQAATGRKWSSGVQHAGVLRTNNGLCSVTIVSEWLAITAKHCGRANAVLQLNVQTTFNPGVFGIKKIEVNPDLDVEAIFLCCETGLGVTPITGFITSHDRLSFWGYGKDYSNNETHWLTRADFNGPRVCPSTDRPENGSLCWDTTATNNVCFGDSGGPVLQNSRIIGMFTTGGYSRVRPDGSPDCSTVYYARAISVKEMRTWLDQMIEDADPWP